jgi:hypothetical protein
MSGLRNPPAAVRGAGAGALAAMALVLLMAIVPMVRLTASWTLVTLVVVLAVVAIVLCGLLKRGWAWYAAYIVPVALLAGGVGHVALAVLGVLFALLWTYILHVRRSVLGRNAA